MALFEKTSHDNLIYVRINISLMNVAYLPCVWIKNSVKERNIEIRSNKNYCYLDSKIQEIFLTRLTILKN